MIINERHNLNVLLCTLDSKGEIANVYHSYEEMKHTEPDAKFICKYEIYDVELKAIPLEANECYDTAEEALAHFETFKFK